MKTTTLNALSKSALPRRYWDMLLLHLHKTKNDIEPLSFVEILNVYDLELTLWCCRVAPEYAEDWRLFSVFCARQTLFLSSDPRSSEAVSVAETYALGESSSATLSTARIASELAVLDSGCATELASRSAALLTTGDCAEHTVWAASKAVLRAVARFVESSSLSNTHIEINTSYDVIRSAQKRRFARIISR
jgi:hypothetical protein